MIIWDKRLKELFWPIATKIVNDGSEIYNEYENNAADNISEFIKYRATLGNIKYVSIFMCRIVTLITIFIIILSFIIQDNSDINITCKLSSNIVFIYFSTLNIMNILHINLKYALFRK